MIPALVAFDLDDTLAPSKSALDPSMVPLLQGLLAATQVCIISGGQISQFRAQVLTALEGTDEELLARLHLMPTCGTQYWTFRAGTWHEVYAENLEPEQIEEAMAVLKASALSLGLWETHTWGPVLEDRGSQVTFSALGQDAPVDAKAAWDPAGEKKSALRSKVAEALPGLEVRSGGSTSVDVTRLGIDKAYGMTKLRDLTGIAFGDMLFVGDRLDPDGNDFPVIALGIPTRAVGGWTETRDLIAGLLDDAH